MFIPEADVAFFLDPHGKGLDIWTALDLITLLEVLQGEGLLVLVALVSEPEPHTSAVLGGCPHEVTHDPWDVETLHLLWNLFGWLGDWLCMIIVWDEAYLVLVAGL